ncbi:interleukin-22-like [Chiloscyllium plagiosum]|uniref:interleukin-22-like n=1 Tax=Chiloscyllium plagiosum TaxID=36176 RepID=UPI001CB7F86A|nr:interleukin-22-like [Chiloscyllium plagiosum]
MMYFFQGLAALVLGYFAVMASCAPWLKSRHHNMVCHVEEQLLRYMRHKFHALSDEAQKIDTDTDTRLIGKDLFQGLQGHGRCYVLKEVIDFYLGNVLSSEDLHAKYSHLKEIKEFLALLTKQHMSDCNTKNRTQAKHNIDLLKQKLNQLSEKRAAKVIGELFMLLQEIGKYCSVPNMKEPGH